MPEVAQPPAPRQPGSFPDPIPGVLPFNSVSILAGAPGVGKTCLISTMLQRLRYGQEVFGRRTAAPTAIGILCADRGARVARFWLDRAGYADATVYALVEDTSFPLVRLRNKMHLTATLEELLAKLELPPGGLAVVDPLTLFFGNPNDYQGCAIACLEIRRMCERRQITLIGTAHASKQKSDQKTKYKRLQDRILGSAAQLGYADTQMYLASPDETDEKYYTFLWQSHEAPPETFPLGRTESGLFVPFAESTQSQEEGRVLGAITGEEAGSSFAEIVIGSECGKSTVHRYLQELVKDGTVVKVAHGRYRKVAPH